MFFFFFKQKTAYEMRISDWSSDVCLPIWLPDVVREKTSAGRTATCVGFSLRPTAALNAVRALKVREKLMSDFGAGRAEGKAIGKSRRPRSEERRVGNEGVSPGRYRWWAYQ